MNTDKHRFYWKKNQRKKTEWDTDEHGYTRIRIDKKISTEFKNLKTKEYRNKTLCGPCDLCGRP